MRTSSPRQLFFALISVLLLAAVLGADKADGADARIVLALDQSGSMAQQGRHPTLVAAVAATLAVLPDGSTVGLVGFNHLPSELSPLTALSDGSRLRLVESVAAIAPAGGTDILAGVARALDMLGDGGGTLIILSDGVQTGATNTPWPESMWAAAATTLARKAREKGVVVQALGLVLQPGERTLLERLASETAGEYIDVPSPAELVTCFATLAASHGRYWKRSTPGSFEVLEEGDQVIQLIPSGAREGLSRIVDGREVGVNPAFRVERAGVCVLRSRLSPGRYRFQPDSAGRRSDLLRPMGFVFEYPRQATLPAGRESSLVFRAKRPFTGRASFENLTLKAEVGFGQGANVELTATADLDGVVTLPVSAPPRIGPFQVALQANQDGWSHRLAPWSGALITPQPLEVSLSGREAPPLCLTTRGEETEVRLIAEVATEPFKRGIELTVGSPDAPVRVRPERVRLERPKETVLLTLTREDEAGTPSRTPIEGTIRFGLEATDLVPPQFRGGAREVTWDFQWKHCRPELRLKLNENTATRRPAVAARGCGSEVPVGLEGLDLEGRPVGVRIDGSRLPSDFRVTWVRDGSPISLLEPGDRAALAISVGLEVRPGRHRLEFAALASAPDVLLNGRNRPLELSYEVEVPSPDLSVRLVEGPGRWSVVAPVDSVRRLVDIEVTAADGGSLPPDVSLRMRATPPVNVMALEASWEGTHRLRQAFACSIPAQTRPFSGSVSWSAHSGGEVSGRGADLAVVVGPTTIRVETVPPVAELNRYPAWLEFIVRAFRLRKPVEIDLRATGPLEQARCGWALVDDGQTDGGVVRPLRASQRLSFDPRDRPKAIVLRAAYEHTGFEPASDFPLRVRYLDRPVPPGIWAALGLLLLALLLTRLLPVGIVLDEGAIVRSFGTLNIGPVLNLSAVRLRLRRGVFGHRLSRSRRDRDEDLVVVDLGTEKQPLAPGQSIPVPGGATVEVLPAEERSRSFMIQGAGQDRYRSEPDYADV